MKLKLSFILALVIGLHSFSANADTVRLNPRPRMLSMGGAGVATLGDKDSAMMNPAGLQDIEKSRWEILPITFEVPFVLDAIYKASDLKDVTDKNTATNDEKRQALQALIDEVATEAVSTRINIYPSYTTKHLHVGLLAEFYASPRLRLGGASSNQGTEFGANAATAGLIIGGSYGFLEEKLQIGATFKPIYRGQMGLNEEQTLHDILLGREPNASVQDVLLGTEKFEQRGFGLGVDLGVKYFIPYMEDLLKPAVGVTFQDIGHTRFMADTKYPADIPQSLSVGLAVHPRLWLFKTAFALDFRAINEQQAFLNMLHFGGEATIWDILAIRAGVSQGYFTGGLGVDLRFFELDAYVSAQEAGRKAHLQDETVLGVRISAGL